MFERKPHSRNRTYTACACMCVYRYLCPFICVQIRLCVCVGGGVQLHMEMLTRKPEVKLWCYSSVAVHLWGQGESLAETWGLLSDLSRWPVVPSSLQPPSPQPCDCNIPLSLAFRYLHKGSEIWTRLFTFTRHKHFTNWALPAGPASDFWTI